MSFTLTMSGVIVGRSELEGRDPTSGIARGEFRPGLGYDLAEPVFALYDGANGDQEALARYRRARDALRLQLTDDTGETIRFRELHIRKAEAKSGNNAYILEVVSDDPRLWNTSTQSS